MSSIEYTYPSQTPRYDKACEACTPGENKLFTGESLSFKDIIDTVNPLQHLPIIGSLYRGLTGDTISTTARLAGGALMGGPLGFVTAAISAGFESATGGDVASHALASISDSPRQATAAYMKAAALG